MSGYWFPQRVLHSGHPPAWVWLIPPFWLILVPAYFVWLVAVIIWFVISIPVNLIRLGLGTTKSGYSAGPGPLPPGRE